MSALPGSHPNVLDVAWRQGSVLCVETLYELQDQLPTWVGDIGESDVAVVISQDCDLQQGSMKKEPYVEVVVGKVIPKLEGLSSFARHPRLLSIELLLDDETVCAKLEAGRRFMVEKAQLFGHSPRGKVKSEEHLNHLRAWLANRYLRLALPDEFNIRAKAALDNMKNLFESSAVALEISEVYVSVEPETELSGDDEYAVSMYFALPQDRWSILDVRKSVTELIGTIEGAFSDCVGLDLGDFNVLSEQELTLYEIRNMRRFSFEYVTFGSE